MRITMGKLRDVLTEASMPVKPPKTPKEKQAMVDLIKQVSGLMMVTPDEMDRALANAAHDDWTEAMELLSTFYFMRGIRGPKPN